MECEVDYLSKIHQLEHDLKDREEEVRKWRAWKVRADIHGKQLAETLIERDRGAYSWQVNSRCFRNKGCRKRIRSIRVFLLLKFCKRY